MPNVPRQINFHNAGLQIKSIMQIAFLPFMVATLNSSDFLVRATTRPPDCPAERV